MEPVAATDLSFRKLCLERFILAILYSIALQYLLVTVFLLFVNVDLLHPITWLTSTVGLLVSPLTWLRSVPLATALTVHGFVLARMYLLESRYYPTLFAQLKRSIMQRFVVLCTAGSVGCLTAWFYTRFLRADYRQLVLMDDSTHDQQTVLNERFMYLFVSGLFAGCYFFARGQHTLGGIEWSPVPLSKWTQFRDSFCGIFIESIRRSFVPSFVYLSFYYTVSVLLRSRIAVLFGFIRLKEISTVYSFYCTATDIRLLLYTWLVFALILTNMNLMLGLFRIFLNERQEFSIQVGAFHQQTKGSDPPLATALAYRQIPIIQQMAAEDLATIAQTHWCNRRKQLYELTVPGGHPNNWRQVCDTCLKLIREFTHELTVSIGGIELKPPPPMVLTGGRLRPTTSMDRERLLRQQYNQNFGIRSLSTPALSPTAGAESGQLSAGPMDLLKIDTLSLPAILSRVPGYQLIFVESKTAKSYYLLSVQSQLVASITQSLTALACCSLEEDQYGVVQDDLPSIVHALLELKKVVDKIGAINLDVKRIDRNYIALKGAVKRSLYRFTQSFAPYLNDLVIEPEDLQALQPFLRYHV